MNLETIHHSCRELEDTLREDGMTASSVRAHVNFYGDPLLIIVEAAEPFDENGHWSRRKSFAGRPDEAGRLLFEATDWVYQLPNAEGRAVELLIQRLNEMADQLPKGGSEVAREAMGQLKEMLMGQAMRLAKSGLPSPDRISQRDDREEIAL